MISSDNGKLISSNNRNSFLVLTRDTLACLADSNLLAGKRCIVVGAKSDLARTRVVSPSEGCSLAMAQGVKFTEISAGVGCNIDTLLVGIVLQCRYKGLESGLFVFES